MPEPLDPSYRDHLQALADRFAASVPARMDDIAAALAAAGAAPQAAQLERLHETLHTVAGSAGSFGFAALGAEARRLEQGVRGQLSGEPGWPALARDIQAYIDWARRDPRGTIYPAHD